MVAHRGVSIQTHLDTTRRLVSRWRRMELDAWKHVLDAGDRAPRLATAHLGGAGPVDVGSALEWGAGSFFPDEARNALQSFCPEEVETHN